MFTNVHDVPGTVPVRGVWWRVDNAAFVLMEHLFQWRETRKEQTANKERADRKKGLSQKTKQGRVMESNFVASFSKNVHTQTHI